MEIPHEQKQKLAERLYELVDELNESLRLATEFGMDPLVNKEPPDALVKKPVQLVVEFAERVPYPRKGTPERQESDSSDAKPRLSEGVRARVKGN